MLEKINRYQVATSIAVIFHIIGLAGILFLGRDQFIRYTPVNMLISFFLLIWTQKGKDVFFVYFILGIFFTGYGVEVIGVHTGWLFGDYSYGDVLGVKLLQVPLLIGINWVILIYCCGISIHTLLMKAITRVAVESRVAPMALKAASIIIDGATLAVLFDWLMEPVAVKLGFWKWLGTTGIPTYNYFCWFIISALMLAAFHFLPFHKQNKFAINLLLVQALFFLILRTFLND